MNLSLDAINVFLSPRQLHVIILFCDCFLGNNSTSNFINKEQLNDEAIEIDLQSRQQRHRRNSGMSLGGQYGYNHGGWSTNQCNIFVMYFNFLYFKKLFIL